MKKLALIFAVIFTLTACRNEKTKETTASVIDTLSYSYDSVKVFSKNNVKNTGGILDTTKAVITFPVFSNKNLNSYIQKQVTNYISEEEKNITYKYLADSFIKGYDQFYAENKDTFQNWFLTINIKVLHQQKDYIALQYLHSDYSGGAHPNSNFFYINYNTKSNLPITLDSLIDYSQKPKLVKIAEEIFRKDEKLSPTDPLEGKYFFENGKFSLPENFYVSDKGLVFLYNPYEIKPYVDGITKLIIPFTKLKDIAKSNTIISLIN